MFAPTDNMLVLRLFIWIRLLITSAGNMTVHKTIPPAAPATIVRQSPMSSFFWFGLEARDSLFNDDDFDSIDTYCRSKSRTPSYAPKKKKYPGISRINVEVNPRYNPMKPSTLRICLVNWKGLMCATPPLPSTVPIWKSILINVNLVRDSKTNLVSYLGLSKGLQFTFDQFCWAECEWREKRS